MAQIGTLQAEFPWGLLVISDEDSDLQVPDSRSPDERVTASADAATVVVMHAQFGEVDVRIWDEEPAELAVQPIALGNCRLTTETGRLIVGDVQRNVTATISITPGTYTLRAFGDDLKEAEIVDIILTRTAS